MAGFYMGWIEALLDTYPNNQPSTLANMMPLQVTDYLLKKGFTRTEATFRKESSAVSTDGRPIRKRVDEMGPERYAKAYKLLRDWIENGLDLYKVCYA